MKAYVVGDDRSLLSFLPDLEITDKLKEAKLVIFGDGPIVSPSLYKEKKIDIDLKCDINRDRSDKAIYTKLKPDQIAVGISRGACFLSVMNGAKLVQYSTRKQPNCSYDIEFKNGDKKIILSALSDWVQSINLESCEEGFYQLLAVSRNSSDYIAENEVKRFMRHNGDPEIIKFQKPKCPTSICIQFHPEWMPESYLSKLVKQIIYEHANS